MTKIYSLALIWQHQTLYPKSKIQLALTNGFSLPIFCYKHSEDLIGSKFAKLIRYRRKG